MADQEFVKEPSKATSRGYFYSNYGGGPYPDIETRTDDDIKRGIESRLSSGPSNEDLNKKINFEIEAGIVTLSGEVEHIKQKNAIGNDISEIPGVWDVRNNITVKQRH